MTIIRPVWASLLGLLTAGAVLWLFSGPARHAAMNTADPAGGPPGLRDAAVVRIERAASRQAPAPDRAARERQSLRAMSETFRNTSFLIAIRKAGFECPDVLDAASGGADDKTIWRVKCGGGVAYLVGVDAAGKLKIDPMSYAEGGPFLLGGDDPLDEARPPQLDPSSRPPPNQ